MSAVKRQVFISVCGKNCVKTGRALEMSNYTLPEKSCLCQTVLFITQKERARRPFQCEVC